MHSMVIEVAYNGCVSFLTLKVILHSNTSVKDAFFFLFFKSFAVFAFSIRNICANILARGFMVQIAWTKQKKVTQQQHRTH